MAVVVAREGVELILFVTRSDSSVEVDSVVVLEEIGPGLDVVDDEEEEELIRTGVDLSVVVELEIFRETPPAT